MSDQKATIGGVENEPSHNKEYENVTQWRLDQAVLRGADLRIAEEIAHNHSVDLHAWEDLVKLGCSPETAYRILAPLV